MMKMNDLLDVIAKRARFTKADVKTILDTLVQVFEEAARENVPIKVRGFGYLYYQMLGERKTRAYTDKKGIRHPEQTFPPTQKVVFKLSENIRYSHRRRKNGRWKTDVEEGS